MLNFVTVILEGPKTRYKESKYLFYPSSNFGMTSALRFKWDMHLGLCHTFLMRSVIFYDQKKSWQCENHFLNLNHSYRNIFKLYNEIKRLRIENPTWQRVNHWGHTGTLEIIVELDRKNSFCQTKSQGKNTSFSYLSINLNWLIFLYVEFYKNHTY